MYNDESLGSCVIIFLNCTSCPIKTVDKTVFLCKRIFFLHKNNKESHYLRSNNLRGESK